VWLCDFFFRRVKGTRDNRVIAKRDPKAKVGVAKIVETKNKQARPLAHISFG